VKKYLKKLLTINNKSVNISINKKTLAEEIHMKFKKVISILLLTTMILATISGCSSDKNKDADMQKDNGQASNDNNTIVMYTNAEYPPYEYFDGDKIVGVDVDIANMIAEELGKELKVEHVEFDSIVPAIEAGRGDFGAAGMAITPERLESVDFSIPYIGAGQNVIYKTESGLDTLEELAGKTVGVQLGTTCESSMDEAITNGVLKDSGTIVKQYSSPLDAAQDLYAGRIDAVIVNTASAEKIVKENNNLSTNEIDLKTEKMAICVAKGNQELLDKINGILEKLMADGTIEEFIKAHSEE